MVEIIGDKELLRDVVYGFAQLLQVFKAAFPIKLNLLALVARLPCKLFDSS